MVSPVGWLACPSLRVTFSLYPVVGMVARGKGELFCNALFKGAVSGKGERVVRGRLTLNAVNEPRD